MGDAQTMAEGKLNCHLTQEPGLAPLLILLTSLDAGASLTKLALRMRHILWHLLQELVRFLGHSEVTEDPRSQHFAFYSVSFPPPLTYA